MAVPRTVTWSIKEHAKAKHAILRRYLEAWFPILNSWNNRIIYLDGFCGPGRYEGGEPGSPLIALEVAKSNRGNLKGEIVFWFIDEDERRIQNLKDEIGKENWPAHFRIKEPEKGLFHEKLSEALDELEKDKKVIAPTFAFLDPFGFSGLPFSLVKRLLGYQNCEVLITFMIDSINRFLTQEEVLDSIFELFGTPDARKIADEKNGDRIDKLRRLYQEQLKKVAKAKFVRVFQMFDKNNRPIYDLFFATNHPRGHQRMKEAMWSVDPTGGSRFSDATDPDQLFLLDPAEKAPKELRSLLLTRFAGKKVDGREVDLYVWDETAYLGRHKTEVLRHLESAGKISVDEMTKTGKKRRKTYFPDDCIITFS